MNVLLPPAPAVLQASLPPPDAARASRLVRRLAGLFLIILLALLAALAFPVTPALAELRASGLGAIAAGSLIVPLTGLLATVPLARARLTLGDASGGSLGVTSLGARQLWLPRRLRRWQRPAAALDPALRLARLARRPQGVIVPMLAVGCALLLWSLTPAAPLTPPSLTMPGTTPALIPSAPAMPSPAAFALGIAAIVFAFPLLLAERIVATASPKALPEAEGLQALLFLPVLLIPVAGVLEIGAGLGLGWTRPLFAALSVYIGVVAAELGVRALANWFLPPPAPESARAAVTSFAALLLQPGRLAPDGLAAPLRAHFGIDFSRSWALRYARAASLPIGLALATIAWGLTGVTILDLDQRGIYERFGAPAAVWTPGAHLGLPWPLGRVRRVDLGTVHSVVLGEGLGDVRSPAEAAAPASADRLWEQVHPSEVSFLIASEDRGAQSFQTVNIDLQVLYRVGLANDDALHAAYAIDTPDSLVRSETGRLMARVFAAKQIDAVLGDGRETMADTLRQELQSELDRLHSGLEIVSVQIQAIHPPPGAAEAYHYVQAAEIIANTAISTEQGRALATAARSRQVASDLTLAAQGLAADTVSQANVGATGFTADVQAAAAGRTPFLFERYLANVATALAKSPLVIVDHRLTGTNAPSIDLRSFAAPLPRSDDD